MYNVEETKGKYYTFRFFRLGQFHTDSMLYGNGAMVVSN